MRFDPIDIGGEICVGLLWGGGVCDDEDEVADLDGVHDQRNVAPRLVAALGDRVAHKGDGIAGFDSQPGMESGYGHGHGGQKSWRAFADKSLHPNHEKL